MDAPIVVVVMGVAGCGKSTVGAMLAQRLGCPFYEGDEFHPPSNVAKMQAGTPLCDDDRWPWLESLAGIVQQHVSEGSPAVLSCSALKPAYRHLLRTGCRRSSSGGSSSGHGGSVSGQGASSSTGIGAAVAFVLLEPARDVLEARLHQRAARGGHFMPASLLGSQLQALQYDPAELYLCFSGEAGAQAPVAIVEAILQRMGRLPG